MIFLQHMDCLCDCQGSWLETNEPDMHTYSFGGSFTEADIPTGFAW